MIKGSRERMLSAVLVFLVFARFSVIFSLSSGRGTIDVEKRW